LAWLIAMTFLLSEPLGAREAVERTASAQRVIVTPASARIDDTAALAELMRDLERGSPWFYETVVFERSVATSGNRLWLVAAADVGAAAADAVDDLRLALTPVDARGEAELRTDAALGVIDGLPGVGSRRLEVAGA
jgi:hypothetical protein